MYVCMYVCTYVCMYVCIESYLQVLQRGHAPPLRWQSPSQVLDPAKRTVHITNIQSVEYRVLTAAAAAAAITITYTHTHTQV
jgi:hypothetical protein